MYVWHSYLGSPRNTWVLLWFTQINMENVPNVLGVGTMKKLHVIKNIAMHICRTKFVQVHLYKTR